MTNRITTPNATPASAFCFGAMQFGGKASTDASRAMYHACRARGINFFDTAHVYTGGQSETLLGQLAAPERDDVIIASKIAFTAPPTKANTARSFDESRTRLGMDCIDLLYMHRWDGHVALEEIFETLAALQNQGSIRYIGVSNYAAWQVMKAQAVAAKLGTKIDVIQPMYNLVKRQAEVEILPMSLDQGIGVCPYSPLGGGLLTGKYATGAGGRLLDDPMYTSRYNMAWMHDAAAALPALASKHNTDPATLAVAWVARNKAVTAPIISARSAEQLQPSLDALDFEMTDAIYAEVTALTPTLSPATDRLEEA